MSNFCCDTCGHVDDTELAYPDGLPEKDKEGKGPFYYCTKCQTDGKWHDKFPLEKFRPGMDQVINRPSPVGLG